MYRLIKIGLILTTILVSSCSRPDTERFIRGEKIYQTYSAMMETQYYTNDGMVLAYSDMGSGEPLFLIHGAYLSKEYWIEQIPAFTNGYRLILPDLRGHGESEGFEGEYSIDLYVEDMITLMDDLNIDSAAICGHSTGGMVAQLCALKHPERVTALILADTTYGVKSSGWESFLTGISMSYLKNTPIFKQAKTIADQYGKITPAVHDLMYYSVMRYEDDPDQYFRMWVAVTEFDVKSRLTEIACPVLILPGEKNKQTHSHAERMDEQIPDSTLIMITNAGHVVTMDNPDQFNAVVIQFLSGIGD